MLRAFCNSSGNRSRSGATAVEFAIILPVLVMTIMGFFELGMLLHVRSTLQFGVDKAARFAIVNQDSTASVLQTKVLDEISETMNTTGITVTVTSEVVSGVDFRVLHATKDHNYSLPFLDHLSSVEINGHARFPLTGQ